MPEDTAQSLRLLVLDVDGVLTDGSILIDGHGMETKRFHVRDGLGIQLWRLLGYDVAIITGRSSAAVQHRATELGIRHVFQGVGDKVAAFGELLKDLDINASQAAVIGDDLPDLPMMRLSGYPMAVADGSPEVRETAEFVTTRPGGRGAVREAIEHLLKLEDRWDEALAYFA
ncbi:MAG: HAD-IIIA family hydrolase [Planctomycetes bacterium]|nr:HAD-IIIA family hydrolase [Planctomycetota bacterium]